MQNKYTFRLNVFHQLFKIGGLIFFWGIVVYGIIKIIKDGTYDDMRLMLSGGFVLTFFTYVGSVIFLQLLTGCKFITTDENGINVFQILSLKFQKYKWSEIEGYSKGEIVGRNSTKVLILHTNENKTIELTKRDYFSFDRIEEILRVNLKYIGESQIVPNMVIGHKIYKPK